MTQNEFEELTNQSETELLLIESKDALNKLKNGIVGTFEYKNRSRDWKYFVFSYKTTEWETVTDIKQKYVRQYWWRIEWILVTDDSWREINKYSRFWKWE